MRIIFSMRVAPLIKTNTITTHFITKRIQADLRSNRCDRVCTRFPPEPNGYLHLGHAKAALLNYTAAKAFNGQFFLRLDDTNPQRESSAYIEAIKHDVHWLGCDWDGEVRHTSDYFSQLYEFAQQLIASDLAYVCALSGDEISKQRGTLTQAGINSIYRDRSVDENMTLFEQMRAGKHLDGSYVLRAKIDMASGNLNMRDPVLYRIRHIAHHRTANQWRIYPTYDFSHCLSDAIEGITHSLCTLEFQDHRPLYDWLLQSLNIAKPPQQIEFARLNLEATVMSKRKLQSLIDAGVVRDWDDPRLPTLAGLRRRGVPALALHDFCNRIGVAKADNRVGIAQLTHSVRHELETHAQRVMCVLRPLKVKLSNWPAGQSMRLSLAGLPNQEDSKTRSIDFTGEFYIEEDDYMDDPPPKYRRLSVGRSVRLRGAWVIRCDAVERDAQGKPTLLICSYDADTLGVKPDYSIGGVIHWVPFMGCITLHAHLFEPLFDATEVDEENLIATVNPDSDRVLTNCKAEAEVANMQVGEVRQFERQGYFCLDTASDGQVPIFNRVVPLRDSWSARDAKH